MWFHRSFRWAAYRQFVWWTLGRMGRRNRRIIPACVVHKIRSTFPSGEGEEYGGYDSGLNYESD